MMKKGQVLGQPFIYIFISVVAVLLLVFGVNIILNLKNSGEQVSETMFFKDIESKYNTVYSDSYGSVVSLEGIKVPPTITEICFVDYLETFDLSEISSSDLKKIIESSNNIKDDKNIFILGSELQVKKISNLDLDKFALCDSLKDGKVNIKFINQGQEIKAEAI